MKQYVPIDIQGNTLHFDSVSDAVDCKYGVMFLQRGNVSYDFKYVGYINHYNGYNGSTIGLSNPHQADLTFGLQDDYKSVRFIACDTHEEALRFVSGSFSELDHTDYKNQLKLQDLINASPPHQITALEAKNRDLEENIVELECEIKSLEARLMMIESRLTEVSTDPNYNLRQQVDQFKLRGTG